MKLSFGEKVLNLQEDSDMKQSELAKEVGMTQRKISDIECSRNEPSIDDIVALCLHFQISADYLLGLPNDLEYPKK